MQQEPDAWTQDSDVLDTWFSSALWPFSVMGWPDKTADLEKFYPTSVLITGHDILFFWVARMILMGEYTQGKPPFHETFLHGLIYGKSYWREDSEGAISYLNATEKKSYDLGTPLPQEVHSKWEKMSKSKGNIIDPIELIAEYGTDALRMALCSSVTYARQIDLDRRKFEEFKNFTNKIWNGARFVFMNLEEFDAFDEGLDLTTLALEDRWILSVLNRTIAEVNQNLNNYSFDKAATRAYEFFWNDFCAIYVELAKPILFGKAGTPELKKNKQKLLAILLSNSIRLLHPIAPFITEELFNRLKEKFSTLNSEGKQDPYTKETIRALQSPACIQAPYPEVIDPSDIDLDVEKTFEKMNELVRTIRNIRAEMQIPPGEKNDLTIIGTGEEREMVEKHQSILFALTPTRTLQFSEEEGAAFGANALVGSLKLCIPIPEALKEKEKQRLIKEQDKLVKVIEGLKGKLANEEFTTKAPKEVVEKLEGSLAQSEKQLSEIQSKLHGS